MRVVAEARRAQPLDAAGVGARRAEAAEVEDGRAQRRRDRRVVELGVVGQGDDGGAGVEPELGERGVGPVVDEPGVREAGRAGEGLARVDDRHVVAGDAAPSAPAPGRCAPRRPPPGAAAGCARRETSRRRSRSGRPAAPPPPAPRAGRRGRRPAAAPSRRAAPRRPPARAPPAPPPAARAGPATAPARRRPARPAPGWCRRRRARPRRRPASLTPYSQHARPAVLERLQRLGHHRALDAAARDRAHHLALAGDRQLRPARPRRRAPGLDDGGERRALAGAQPVERGLGDRGRVRHRRPRGRFRRI